MSPYKHTDCGGLIECIEGPDPPDPDRHGNLRIAHKCAACGERFTILVPRHGRRRLPADVTAVDDRGVAPSAVADEEP